MSPSGVRFVNESSELEGAVIRRPWPAGTSLVEVDLSDCLRGGRERQAVESAILTARTLVELHEAMAAIASRCGLSVQLTVETAEGRPIVRVAFAAEPGGAPGEIL